jgi:hypothetical protein
MLIAVGIIALKQTGDGARAVSGLADYYGVDPLRAAEAIAVLPLPRLSLSRIQAPGSACLAQRR